MMKTRIGAVIFFGLIILSWFLIPLITPFFDKKERQKAWKETMEEMKKEDNPTTEEGKKKKLAKEQKWSVLRPIIIIAAALIIGIIFGN